MMEAEVIAPEINFSSAEEVVDESYYLVLDQKLWTQWRRTSEEFGFHDIEASLEESQRFIQLLLHVASLLLPRVVCERSEIVVVPPVGTPAEDVDLPEGGTSPEPSAAPVGSLQLAKNTTHVELVDDLILTAEDKARTEASSCETNSLPLDSPACIPLVTGFPHTIIRVNVRGDEEVIKILAPQTSIPTENQQRLPLKHQIEHVIGLSTKNQSVLFSDDGDSIDQPNGISSRISNYDRGCPDSTSGTSRRTYQCPNCPALVGSRPSLRHHMESRHSGGVTYPCDVCPKSFASSILLYRHRRAVHTETQQPASVCPRCGKLYKTAASLKLHMKTAHDGVRFACPHCAKTYTTRHHLQAHLAREHRRRERFLCSTCQRVYWSLSALKEHVKTHLPGRVFCEICGKTFTYVRSLRAHMIAHSEEKHFSCDICSQTFKRKSHLTRHMSSVHKDPS